eukprot:772646-Rhodomonas_salina.2
MTVTRTRTSASRDHHRRSVRLAQSTPCPIRNLSPRPPSDCFQARGIQRFYCLMASVRETGCEGTVLVSRSESSLTCSVGSGRGGSLRTV